MKKIIAQKAVIQNGDLFLLLHRANNESAFPDVWDFPGGKLEPGEKPLDSLIREVQEETGLQIIPGTVIGTYNSQLKDAFVEFIIYRTHSFNGELKISEEHQEYRWLPVSEITKLPCTPFMDQLLKDIAKE